MLYSCLLIGICLCVLLLAKRAVVSLALIGFPGVVLHETMHLIVGLVLFAKPQSMRLFPKRDGHGWQFGSVSFTGLNILNAAPVAYAPLLLLIVAWYLFQQWMVPLFMEQHYEAWAFVGYIISCALFYSLPSSTDIKVAGLSTLFWLILAFLGWYGYFYFFKGCQPFSMLLA